MKSFRCGDVIAGCTAEMQGVDDDDVVRQVVEHAVRDHGMQPGEDVVAAVRARVRPS